MTACKHPTTKTVDVRHEGQKGASRRTFSYHRWRRKVCTTCGDRFGTFEMTDQQIATAFHPLLVAIRDDLLARAKEIDELLLSEQGQSSD